MQIKVILYFMLFPLDYYMNKIIKMGMHLFQIEIEFPDQRLHKIKIKVRENKRL